MLNKTIYEHLKIKNVKSVEPELAFWQNSLLVLWWSFYWHRIMFCNTEVNIEKRDDFVNSVKEKFEGLQDNVNH